MADLASLLNKDKTYPWPPEAGFYCTLELASKFGQSRNTLKIKMDKLSKSGKVEKRVYRKPGNGVSTSYFRVK